MLTLHLGCRWTLESSGQLEPRRSALEDDFEEEDEKEEEDEPTHANDVLEIDKVSCSFVSIVIQTFPPASPSPTEVQKFFECSCMLYTSLTKQPL